MIGVLEEARFHADREAFQPDVEAREENAAKLVVARP
jgi:hypothetical protein